MADIAHPAARPYRHPRRHTGHRRLIPALTVLLAVMIAGVGYVGYVLWPRWPDAPVTLDAPSLPIVIAGVTFNIEPAAIRQAVQRHPGTQARVDLEYRWPSLLPPDRTTKLDPRKPLDPDRRLFVTIAVADGTLPLMERVRDIYPRYLVPQPSEGPPGLTLRPFRDDTPYKGEELVFESDAPTHFLARCSRHGVVNSGNCLLERRVGNADITFRFPRVWLTDWKAVASGIDKLMARWQGR